MAYEVFFIGKALDIILAVLGMALERSIVCSLMFAAEPLVEILEDTNQGGLTSIDTCGRTIFHKNHTDDLSWMNASRCVTEEEHADPAELEAYLLGSRQWASDS